MTIKAQQRDYTLVVGLGKTGLSVVSYLRALGEAVVVVDSRDIPPGLQTLKEQHADVPCYTGAFERQPGQLFSRARRIILSPGISLRELVLQQARQQAEEKGQPLEICGDIDLFAHAVKAPVIGITGSNGKSTVTLLLTEMAKQAGIHAVACGNIGTPVLQALDDAVELYVMELSSFQLETLHCLPMQAAVVLNISADHLDRYDNLAAYALCKQAIYTNAAQLIVNRDDVLAAPVSGPKGALQTGFGLSAPTGGDFGLREIDGQSWLCRGEQALLAASSLPLCGRHNLQNALAALALAQAAGIDMDACLEALQNFSGLAHRSQRVAHFAGIDWIDDSKATNVGATLAALQGLDGRKILIAGGQAKGADFAALTEAVAEHCPAVVLIGEDRELLRQAMPAGIDIVEADSMDAAVEAAWQLANEHAGNATISVLLAPACASFDMFRGFEHRGEVFTAAVLALQARAAS